MYAVDLVFSNGKKVEGLLWTCPSAEGEFKYLDEHSGDIKTAKINNVQSGLWYSDRIRHLAKSEDFMEKARAEGWI